MSSTPATLNDVQVAAALFKALGDQSEWEDGQPPTRFLVALTAVARSTALAEVVAKKIRDWAPLLAGAESAAVAPLVAILDRAGDRGFSEQKLRDAVDATDVDLAGGPELVDAIYACVLAHRKSQHSHGAHYVLDAAHNLVGARVESDDWARNPGAWVQEDEDMQRDVLVPEEVQRRSARAAANTVAHALRRTLWLELISQFEQALKTS